jgi:hypothetical protein
MSLAFSCDECMFWLPDDDVKGECHANAPTYNQIDKHYDNHAVWPLTFAGEWCGQGRVKSAGEPSTKQGS